MNERHLASYLESIRDIGWFSHASEPCSNARVVKAMQVGFDREGKKFLELWGYHTHALESRAQRSLGDAGIDRVFDAVSDAIGDPVYLGICSYFERVYHGQLDEAQIQQRMLDSAIYIEVFDSVKRDVAWAGVEYVLQEFGFFSGLLPLYRQGRWPCSWDGNYPEGRPVVL